MDLGDGLRCRERTLHALERDRDRESATRLGSCRKVFDQAKYDELIELRSTEAGMERASTFFSNCEAAFRE